MDVTRFELPSLGADMEEATLLEWRVRPGDVVHRGQVVAVVDTSKAAVDVEIWQDGVVQALLVEPGARMPVGAAMMTVAARAGATRPAPVSAPEPVPAPQPQPEPQPEPEPQPQPQPETAAPAPARRPELPPGPPHRPPDAAELLAAARRPVSPAARKRARELEVDLARVEASGPNGAVTWSDVERAAEARVPVAAAVGAAAAAPAPPVAAPPVVPKPSPPAGVPAAVDRQAAMRASIAAAMARSKREIPHYYLCEQVPMERALEWLRTRNVAVPVAQRALPAALLLKAVACALARVPELNGMLRDGRFVPSGSVHAGVAIALRGGGLVAPAIHDVQDRPLAELMRALSDLVRRARAGSLRSSEMSDPTITVTQMGDQGVDSVFGVIYPPQVAIVGFGRIAERPWARDGWIRAVPVVTATLSADHRVSDGHRGALFLAELRERLQRPETLDAPTGG